MSLQLGVLRAITTRQEGLGMDDDTRAADMTANLTRDSLPDHAQTTSAASMEPVVEPDGMGPNSGSQT